MSHLKKKKALSSNSLRCTMRGRRVCFTLLGGGDGGGTHPLPHCQRNTLSCVLIEATIPPGALLLLCNVIRQLCLTAVLPPRYISLLRERRAAAQPHPIPPPSLPFHPPPGGSFARASPALSGDADTARHHCKHQKHRP